jgi:hypothetical protein
MPDATTSQVVNGVMSVSNNLVVAAVPAPQNSIEAAGVPAAEACMQSKQAGSSVARIDQHKLGPEEESAESAGESTTDKAAETAADVAGRGGCGLISLAVKARIGFLVEVFDSVRTDPDIGFRYRSSSLLGSWLPWALLPWRLLYFA